MHRFWKNLGLMALGLALWSAPSQAIELKFVFDVNSSGPDVYACNVGLKHTDPGNQVCYLEGTQTACDPAACADEACLTNCKCTSNNGGEYLMDFFNAKHAAWASNGNNMQTTNRQSGQTAMATLFNDQQAWAHRVGELSFNLGSERYGAEYFVDICYRGPQIEYWEKDQKVNFSMVTQTSVTDLNVTPGMSYKALADLATRSEWVCDTQGAGTYKTGRNSSNAYNTLDNEADFGAGDIGGSSTYAPVGGSAITFVNNMIVNNSANSLRFCKVRYYYNEQSVNALRKWQLHGAQVCTYTKIEESAPEQIASVMP